MPTHTTRHARMQCAYPLMQQAKCRCMHACMYQDACPDHLLYEKMPEHAADKRSCARTHRALRTFIMLVILQRGHAIICLSMGREAAHRSLMPGKSSLPS